MGAAEGSRRHRPHPHEIIVRRVRVELSCHRKRHPQRGLREQTEQRLTFKCEMPGERTHMHWLSRPVPLRSDPSCRARRIGFCGPARTSVFNRVSVIPPGLISQCLRSSIRHGFISLIGAGAGFHVRGNLESVEFGRCSSNSWKTAWNRPVNVINPTFCGKIGTDRRT